MQICSQKCKVGTKVLKRFVVESLDEKTTNHGIKWCHLYALSFNPCWLHGLKHINSCQEIEKKITEKKFMGHYSFLTIFVQIGRELKKIFCFLSKKWA